ncbi:TIGR03943 family putative permease subunit [Shouchella shacheensis]|uniref:TIGR03943 family putative permease subunit n=1 Tax=Shouchella shacheensis TaxID=1649580 RepID=UPI00073FF862|nr:TIGR03943 family protein [Shouchella shacheensis]
MKNQKKHLDYFSGILFLGFGLLILAMVLNGSLDYYISPMMRPIVMGGVILFYLLAITQIWRSTSDKQELACDCQKKKVGKGEKLTLLLLTMVLAIGFFLPDYVLSTKMAELKGVSYTFPVSEEMLETNVDYYESYYNNVEHSIKNEEGMLVGDESFMDVLGLLHFQLDQYIGVEVELSGFIYHDEALEPTEFTVGRFAFTCCAADSIGYGFIVEHLGDDALLPVDGWVKVKGVVQERELNGQTIPSITATEVSEISEPERPYVYPTLLSD